MPLTDAEYGRFQRPDDVCPFCYGNNVVLEEEEYSEGETMAESDYQSYLSCHDCGRHWMVLSTYVRYVELKEEVYTDNVSDTV